MGAFWKAFARNRLAIVGGAVVACLAVLAVTAPVVAPWDPNRPVPELVRRRRGNARAELTEPIT